MILVTLFFLFGAKISVRVCVCVHCIHSSHNMAVTHHNAEIGISVKYHVKVGELQLHSTHGAHRPHLSHVAFKDVKNDQ